MSPAAVALILAAAVAHATWNLFSKQAAAGGAVLFTFVFASCALVLYAPVAAVDALAVQPRLTGLNWLFLAGTGVLHAGYFLFLQHGYRRGDLSVGYPIGRGSGALLAAIAGIVLLGERPTALALAGMAAIVAGVILIGIPGRSSETGAWLVAALPFALATGVFIAGYTIWDAYAVSTLRTPPILQGYAGFSVMAAVLSPFALADRDRLAGVWRTYRRQVIGAAVLAPLAYILILTALSFTAVSIVAPAREISVLFGVLVGGRLLGEGNRARRTAAAFAIVAGIIAVAVR